MANRIDLEIIRDFLREDKFIISNHARVRTFQRNISTDDIKNVILLGEVIESYPNDKPCPSALILGFLRTIAIHVVLAQCRDHVRIITVYLPKADKWADYKIRKGIKSETK